MPIVQQNSGTHNGTGSFNVTLPSASLAGNRVVVVIAGNTVVSTPSGWTLRTSQVNWMGHYLWDRAGGSASYSFSASGQLIWWIAEIAGGSYVNALSQNSTAAANTYSTPSLTPTAGERVLIASFGSTHAQSSAVLTVSGWTNSFTEVLDTGVNAADRPMHGVGVREVTANGSTAYSTGVTYSGSQEAVGRSALIAAYSTSSGASAPTVDAVASPATVAVNHGTIILDGTLVGDGGEAPSYTWTHQSGPGTATITDPTLLDTTATVDTAGDHTFRLTATNSAGSDTADTGTVTVAVPVNTAPPTVPTGDPIEGEPVEATDGTWDPDTPLEYYWEYEEVTVETHSGGSVSTVTASTAQAGIGAERSSGGSVAEIGVSATGGGQVRYVAAGAAVSVVAVLTDGVGTAQERGPPGGSASTVSVSATGAGSGGLAVPGGSGAAVAVDATGVGRSSTGTSGGSSATVEIGPSGGGSGTEIGVGGASAEVPVSVAGDGAAILAATGGSVAGVTVAATGGGRTEQAENQQGGSAATIIVSTAGGGTTATGAAGGSTVVVAVLADAGGVGSLLMSGGSVATVATAASSGGTGAEASNGGTSVAVTVSASGGGATEEMESFSGGSTATVDTSTNSGGTPRLATVDGAAATVVAAPVGAGGGAISTAHGAVSNVTVAALGGGRHFDPKPPAERTYTVPAEQRVTSVAAEVRIITVTLGGPVMSIFVKDPDATLDYKVDWGQWLEESETIYSSEWIVPEGLTQPLVAGNTSTTTTVWLSGGENGQTYRVVNRISTTAGRTDDRTIIIHSNHR